MARGAKQLRSRALLGALFAILSFPTAHAARRDPSNVITIVALGDSLTAGYGLLEMQAYPALLQKKLDDDGYGWEVVNAGVSGDTSGKDSRRKRWFSSLLVVEASSCVFHSLHRSLNPLNWSRTSTPEGASKAKFQMRMLMRSREGSRVAMR